jgi:hypothetical protein
MRLKEAIKKLKGNWKQFESFCWSDQPDNAEDWCIVYTHHRDSPIKDLSNASYFRKKLNPLVDRTKDVIDFSANHWAVGHIDGWAVRVVDARGLATMSFRRLVSILTMQEEHVLLDTVDYDERVTRAKWKNIEFYAKSCLPKGHYLKDALPADWVDQVDELLHIIDPNWEDDLDEEGAPRPRIDNLVEALKRADLLETEE